MTDMQVLTIVIAILASLGTLIYNNSRITDVGKRIDDQRDSLGKRLDEQSASFNKRLDEQSASLNKRLDEQSASLNKRLDEQSASLNKRLEEQSASLNKRIDEFRTDVTRHIDDKFNLLVAKLDRMEDNLTRQIADLDVRLGKLEHPSQQN